MANEKNGRDGQTLRLVLGDCIKKMQGLPEGTIGAITTDPPYGLEFMGKNWDAPWKYTISEHGFTDGGNRLPAPTFTSSRNPTCQACGLRQRTWEGEPDKCECEEPEFDSVSSTVSDRQKFQAWCVTWLKECYRVLRPGGTAKVFGATRMMHRMAAAMEEAGFVLEPEHSLEGWGYGSGFPKSLNVGKVLDKAAGAEREVIGSQQVTRILSAQDVKLHNYTVGLSGQAGQIPITAPATEAAKQFDGFGTALKPAWEPILIGRKPVVSVRENCDRDP